MPAPIPPTRTSCVKTSSIVFTFDAAPTLGSSGAIKIYKVGTPDTLVDTLDMSLNATGTTALAKSQPRVIASGTYNAYPVMIWGRSNALKPAPQRLFSTVAADRKAEPDPNYLAATLPD